MVGGLDVLRLTSCSTVERQHVRGRCVMTNDRPTGNSRLKAARQHAGYASQQAFADALTQAAPRIGLGRVEISVRQVRRWESKKPPWPRAEHQQLLVHVLRQSIEE